LTGITSRSRHHATDNKEAKVGNKSGKCENVIYTVVIDFARSIEYVTIVSTFDDFESNSVSNNMAVA
jgi:hypothetical protein